MSNKDYIFLREGPRPVGMQVQYYSQYIEGFGNKPTLGGGLRFRNLRTGCHHDIQIHKDDAEEFCRRVEFWLNLLENCVELGEELQIIALQANSGRGHSASLDIAHILQVGMVAEARATAFAESDKFGWVPELKAWIEANLFSPGEDNPWNSFQKALERQNRMEEEEEN